MNQNTSFIRKMSYLAGLALLLFPLTQLGSPATRDDEGGKLAKLRDDYNLGQSDLGAIDPGSEAIRLATLGMRGVAVSMLWSKANEFKKTEDWTAFQSTLEQLARLQPYFIAVWRFQSWNLSYNVSVESDDLRDRFYYVKQGIKYLKDGILYNRENPVLLDDLGWFIGNKVGRADEHVQYRQMFKLDEELHQKEDTLDQRDNWLASKQWYQRAIRSIEAGASLGNKNPTTFYDSPARSQMSYAEAIEEEGVFGPRAQEGWKEGGRLWAAYGNREMPASFGVDIKLAELDKERETGRKMQTELEGLIPGIAKKVAEEAIAKLTPEQRKALETAPDKLDEAASHLREEAIEATTITADKIAERIAKDDPKLAGRARQLASRLNQNSLRVRMIESNRDVSNYEYWQTRCELEPTAEALKARELAHEAKRRFEEADLTGAKTAYEQCFDLWAKAFDRFPAQVDSPTGSDVMDVVKEYGKVLEQMELRLSDKEVMKRFPLWNLVAANDGQRDFADDLAAWKGEPASGSVRSTAPQDQATPLLVNPADAFSDPVR